jgi:hypothetical protein
MQNNSSKINTVLLVVLIILVGVGIWMLYDKKEGEYKNDQTINQNIPQPQIPIPATPTVATTYTYKNHGFTMELPKGYIPHEEQSEGGPSISIGLPKNSHMAYVTNSTFWEQFNVSTYTYIRSEKIGSTTFKVYDNGGQTTYWYKQGNVGYEFFGDIDLLKTFKFVGWAQ